MMQSQSADVAVEEYNVFYRSKDPDARMLSRFFYAPYTLTDKTGKETTIASSEAFLQGIAFHEDDLRRKQCFSLHGPEAWKFGQKSPRDGFVYFGGEAIPYRSPAYYELLATSEREKFRANEECRLALLKTRGKKLVHRLRGINTAPAFVELLTQIRDEL